MAFLQLFWLLLRMNGLRQMLKRLFIEARIYFCYSTPRKVLNLVRLQLQYLLKRINIQGYPYRYYIEPTNACNLRCPFCFGWQGRSRRLWGMMSVDLFKSIVDQIAPYAYWIDLYNRGEPLLHPDIVTMITYAHQRGIGTKISTNLNSLGNISAEQLVSSGLDHLVVSLDGATQETYAAYRVGGKIDSVLGNLRSIVECKHKLNSATPYITLRTIVTRYNEHELGTIKSIGHQIGVDNIFFVPMIVDITSKDADKWLPRNPNFSFYDYKKRVSKIGQAVKACIELWQRGTITWNGLVFPCCFADGAGEEFGDLNNSNFAEIWNSEQYQASRAVFRDHSTTANSLQITTVCSTCRGSRKRR